MPLHDHPGMKGILKVIAGTLKIQSFTKISEVENGKILVSPDEPKTLDYKSNSTILDEKTSNYHEITALDGVAAFFDVLSPPYSDIEDQTPDSRHCSFYRKILEDNGERKIIKLEQIECPSHYYCDSVHFEKPDFMQHPEVIEDRKLSWKLCSENLK